tara:strand:- start:93 stop:551 length:459 start_codon:yes stop_codon:yes gene_type:complete
MILSSVGDESVVDTEERRYYQQNYQLQLQGFLIDEEEFEVTPAVSRVVTLLGGENSNSKVNKTITTKTKFNFGSLPWNLTETKQYVTKVDLTLIRSSNVDYYDIYINGVWINDQDDNGIPVMVNPNDLVFVQINKKVNNQPAWVLFQETIVR